ncbi:MAG: dockerin type I repeat-containing protein, partial [bacterium]
CLPVGCTDPDGNLSSGPVLISGPGQITDGQWCYTPSGDEVCTVTVRCEDGGGLFCESSFEVTCDHYFCGDADGDLAVNITDAVYLINYIFGDQFAPDPLVAGDADCDGAVNITDVVELINYIFNSGPPPCDACE